MEAAEAFRSLSGWIIWTSLTSGTYELIGEKIQGNPHNETGHRLVQHGIDLIDTPRTFEGLNDFLKDFNYEGIVWHHPDGRMVKIKKRDFGYHWT